LTVPPRSHSRQSASLTLPLPSPSPVYSVRATPSPCRHGASDVPGFPPRFSVHVLVKGSRFLATLSHELQLRSKTRASRLCVDVIGRGWRQNVNDQKGFRQASGVKPTEVWLRCEVRGVRIGHHQSVIHRSESESTPSPQTKFPPTRPHCLPASTSGVEMSAVAKAKLSQRILRMRMKGFFPRHLIAGQGAVRLRMVIHGCQPRLPHYAHLT